MKLQLGYQSIAWSSARPMVIATATAAIAAAAVFATTEGSAATAVDAVTLD